MQVCGIAKAFYVVLSFFAASTVFAQETCGLDSTFDDLSIKGSAGPTNVTLPLPTLAQLEQRRQAREMAAPTIAITSPASGATISDTKTDVVGTYNGPDNTGHCDWGRSRHTHGGQFVVPALPLAAGSNTQTVVATTLDGQTASATVGVSALATPAPLALSASSIAGFALLSISFLSSLRTGAIQSVAVDLTAMARMTTPVPPCHPLSRTSTPCLACT